MDGEHTDKTLVLNARKALRAAYMQQMEVQWTRMEERSLSLDKMKSILDRVKIIDDVYARGMLEIGLMEKRMRQIRTGVVDPRPRLTTEQAMADIIDREENEEAKEGDVESCSDTEE